MYWKVEKCNWFFLKLVNTDSRYNKNIKTTTCKHIQNGQDVRPKNS